MSLLPQIHISVNLSLISHVGFKYYVSYMDRVKRICYLSPMRAAKVQASLRIRAVSPEPSLLAHTSSESRETFRQKARSLVPLNGWACAVEVCHDGMLEDTNSLDGAQLCCLLSCICLIRMYTMFSLLTSFCPPLIDISLTTLSTFYNTDIYPVKVFFSKPPWRPTRSLILNFCCPIFDA